MLSVCCFLLAWVGYENMNDTQERLDAVRGEHYLYCELRTEADDSTCPCCASVAPALGVLGNEASTSNGHLLVDRWLRTATDGAGINMGDSITLTWGFVRDGTNVNFGGDLAGSILIASLDDNFSEADTSADLTQRRWFGIFERTFERYAALSGLNFVYEPNDNGRTLNGSGRGARGVVADIRIGGRPLDGQTGGNTLAFNFFPDSGDMVIDTDNTRVFDADDVEFRNVVAHELGHGLGMDHLISNSERFLLEPSIQIAFDGPQHADVLALHRGYGDHFENGVGNDTSANATPLGDIANFLGVGMDGSRQDVRMSDNDFVSIDGVTDTDVFSFEVNQAGDVTITVTPVGYQYDIAQQGDEAATRVTVDTRELNDLSFGLLDQNGGSVLGVADENGLGVADSLEVFLTPGTYFIEVTSSDVDCAQFYSLASSLVPASVDPVSAQVVYVDFGNLADDANPATGTDIYNTTFAQPGAAATSALATGGRIVLSNLQGIDGSATTTGIEISTYNTGTGQLRSFNSATGGHDPVAGFELFATEDGYWMNNHNSNADGTLSGFVLSFSGLDPALEYDLSLFGGAANQSGTWSVTTGTGDTNAATVTTTRNNVSDWTEVTPSAEGEIVLTSETVASSSDFAGFNIQFASVSIAESVLLGDVDLSNKVDFLDVSPFIALLSSGNFQEEGDIDGSGMVDFLDISPFIAILIGN